MADKKRGRPRRASLDFVMVAPHIDEHPKMRRFARALRQIAPEIPVELMPLLVEFPQKLFKYCGRLATDGCLGQADADDIADICCWPYAAEPFFTALKEAGWLDVDSDGSVHVHDWDQYSGEANIRLEAERERVAEHRRQKKVQSDQSQKQTEEPISESQGSNDLYAYKSVQSEVVHEQGRTVLVRDRERDRCTDRDKEQQQQQRAREGPKVADDPHESPPAAGCLRLGEAFARGEEALGGLAPSSAQVKLRKLGRARGGVPDIPWQQALEYTAAKRDAGKDLRSPWDYAVDTLQKRLDEARAGPPSVSARATSPPASRLSPEQAELHEIARECSLDPRVPTAAQVEQLRPLLRDKGRCRALMNEHVTEDVCNDNTGVGWDSFIRWSRSKDALQEMQ